MLRAATVMRILPAGSQCSLSRSSGKHPRQTPTIVDQTIGSNRGPIHAGHISALRLACCCDGCQYTGRLIKRF